MKTPPRDTRKRRACQTAQSGFTYLWLLFVLAMATYNLVRMRTLGQLRLQGAR
jgi:hypothetical protein